MHVWDYYRDEFNPSVALFVSDGFTIPQQRPKFVIFPMRVIRPKHDRKCHTCETFTAGVT